MLHDAKPAVTKKTSASQTPDQLEELWEEAVMMRLYNLFKAMIKRGSEL